jgi:prophage regulatory protein
METSTVEPPRHRDEKPAASATADASGLARLSEVESLVGLKKSAIYWGISQGTFPAPVAIGSRAVAWKRGAILAWCEHPTPAPPRPRATPGRRARG